ncbi:unnamed protein product, partial [Mesorhabditis belari]|uniref:Uncharacterized protein n=1 Tax=Mesorhabditis belari TaxID=2138241 RepID=A0AAF3EGA6_9BILA
MILDIKGEIDIYHTEVLYEMERFESYERELRGFVERNATVKSESLSRFEAILRIRQYLPQKSFNYTYRRFRFGWPLLN